MKLVLPVGLDAVTSNVPENDHPEWSAGETYALGARVIKAATHRIYESVIADNVGNDPPLSPDAWIDVGPTNRWAMFDAGTGPRTIGVAGPIIVSFTPTAPVDTLGLLDLGASTVSLTITAGADTLYSRNVPMDARAALVLSDLPFSPGAVFEVTISEPAGGPAAVGKLVVGAAFDLGTTETGTTVSLTDFSRRETDAFGVTTIVKRGWAKRFAIRTLINSSRADEVQQQAAEARALPALWVGDAEFESLIAYGFYKDFSIDLEIGSVSYCSLEVEGLPSADGAVVDGDPAAEGTSNFKVVRPFTVTDAVLEASNVPEDDYAPWTADATYALSARVIHQHRVWESVVPDNSGHEPGPGVTEWVDVGATNRWAMFDQALGSMTSRNAEIVVTLAVPQAVSALAALDTDAAQVRVQASDYDRTIDPSGGSAIFLDLAAQPGQLVTVTISPGTTGGSVSIGTMLLGELAALGVTEASPTIGITDFSVKTTDEFGNTTAVPRGWAKRLTATAAISTSATDMVLRRMASLRATPSLWIGDDGYQSLIIYGFFRDFSVEMSERLSICNFTIEGLTKAPPVPDRPPLPAPNWPDIIDSDPVDHPKPDDGATVGSPPGTPVGDRPAEDVVGELDQHAAQIAAAESSIAEAEGDIQELFNTYGDTASAAASADAAAAAEQLAEQHAANAALAETNAETARDAAAGARTAAEGARDTAISEANAAAGSADVAAGHASTASTKADEAAGSASSASASANTATTKAGEAANSATAASSSASAADASSTAAGNSASAAQQSATTATTKAGEADTSADAAATSESNAAASESAAGQSASAAQGSPRPHRLRAVGPKRHATKR